MKFKGSEMKVEVNEQDQTQKNKARFLREMKTLKPHRGQAVRMTYIVVCVGEGLVYRHFLHYAQF